jgi:CheY-like chemotaxis protein
VTREAYDAVVLDIMLPQRSGYAVIAATSLAQQQRSLADLAIGLALGLPVLIALVIGPPHRSDQ